MNKKYQVFISSTFRDLVEERQDALRSILDLGHIPSGMEIFPAADMEQFEYIKKIIDECDYYVLIIGGRYGSVDDVGVSFTEKEYAYAVEQNKTVLAFLHGDLGSLPVAKSDVEPGAVQRLKAFSESVSKGRLVQFWKSREDLKAKVIVSLSKATGDFPQVGWIRGNAAAGEELLEQLNTVRGRLEEALAENEKLKLMNAPAMEGIADVDSMFQVRYRYSTYSSYHAKYLQHDGVVAIKWREIFRAIGPSLVRPASPDTISISLKRYLKENNGIANDIDIYDSDENTIKFQMIGYGLIRAYAAEAKGGGVSEFISLTDTGTRQLVDFMIVRR